MKKNAILLPLLLASCAAPPAGFRPLILPRVSTPARSIEAEKMDMPTLRFEPVTRFEAVIPWQLPPDATNFCWRLQSSTNLADWVDLPDLCLTDPVSVTASNSFLFYRLKGIQ